MGSELKGKERIGNAEKKNPWKVLRHLQEQCSSRGEISLEKGSLILESEP